MLDRIRLGLLAMLIALGVSFAAAARADDKAKAAGCPCTYCEAVRHVSAAMRCAKCKDAAAQCAACTESVGKLLAVAACGECAKENKPCDDCKDLKLEGDCKFCAEKKTVAEEVYCCKKCDAAEKVCPKCEDMRKQVLAIECKACAAKKG